MIDFETLSCPTEKQIPIQSVPPQRATSYKGLRHGCQTSMHMFDERGHKCTPLDDPDLSTASIVLLAGT